MLKHSSYPKIGQLRNIIHSLRLRFQYVGKDENGDPIYDETRVLPIVKFVGTVKLHGTNSAFTNHGDEIGFQSRTNMT